MTGPSRPLAEDVADYEDWLATQCAVVRTALDAKYALMASNAFSFLRCTCFRFARELAHWLPGLASASRVPSVGDAHIENWGTWRDGEGRLVWGVNDFDEAARLPYVVDLVRLATSANLADLPEGRRDRTKAILDGYRRGLEAPGPCFVDDTRPWLQALATRPATTVGAFAKRLAKAEPANPPPEVAALLLELVPIGTEDVAFFTWQRGGGSLGRPRFLVVGRWRGGPVVREAKALAPSAWDWAAGDTGAPSLIMALATGRYRAPEQFLKVRSGFVVRRIASDSEKIDLGDGEARAFGVDLLAAMGADLAAVHLSETVNAEVIVNDLDRRGADWLHEAAKIAQEQVETDFASWRDIFKKRTHNRKH